MPHEQNEQNEGVSMSLSGTLTCPKRTWRWKQTTHVVAFGRCPDTTLLSDNGGFGDFAGTDEVIVDVCCRSAPIWIVDDGGADDDSFAARTCMRWRRNRGVREL